MKLDLYTPAKPGTKPLPVLIFLYGGGFATGDKILADIPGNVVYANIGHYFAEKFGFKTVIIDYRLIKHGARYPSGAQDLDHALTWVEKELPETERIFLLGNSAGGYHVSSWALDVTFAKHRNMLFGQGQGPKVSAICILSSSFRFYTGTALRPLLEGYIGSTGPEVDDVEPTNLMIRATQGLHESEVGAFPPYMIMVNELDPEQVKESSSEFWDLWSQKGGKGQLVEIAGHNHMSSPLALATGIAKEEQWGSDLGKWLSSVGV